ncbi:hypothetical protein [Nocardia australiensis]|uniref:hypothetical protein n=1 Tax=Nocardia australiensis TaxID=2887191 RepID=UPI0035590469
MLTEVRIPSFAVTFTGPSGSTLFPAPGLMEIAGVAGPADPAAGFGVDEEQAATTKTVTSAQPAAMLDRKRRLDMDLLCFAVRSQRRANS